MEPTPIFKELLLMQLRPGFDESLLTAWQSPCDQFNGIHSVNGHFILIIGVKMRPMVLCSRFGKHANDDSEKPRNFRHLFSLRYGFYR